MICKTTSLFASVTLGDADLKDPTEPTGFVAKSGLALRTQEPIPQLTAIVISGDRRTAVIDGHILSVGDRIGHKVLKEIGSYSVKLDDNGKEMIINLLNTTPVLKGSERNIDPALKGNESNTTPVLRENERWH